MERISSHHPEQQHSSQHPPSHPAYPSPFALPPTTQPPVQMPYSDPFSTIKDPFYPGSHNRRESSGSRAWQPTPLGSNGTAPPQSLLQQTTVHPSHQALSQTHPPPYPSAASTQMSLPPYDAPRRASLGGATSPPHNRDHALQYNPPYSKSAMPPPPSPTYSANTMPHSSARAPPSASAFPGLRDFNTSHRSGSGMSISSMLGGGGSDNQGRRDSPSAGTSLSHSLQPPSPGRARSSSMRERYLGRDMSPTPRENAFGEPRAASAINERLGERHREGGFGSPQPRGESMYSFRNFQPNQLEMRRDARESGLTRPTSQPTERAMPRTEEMHPRDPLGGPRLPTVQSFIDPQPPFGRNDHPRYDQASFLHNGVTSNPRDHEYNSRLERDPRYGPLRHSSNGQSSPHDDGPSPPRDPIRQGRELNTRDFHDGRSSYPARRDMPRSSPSEIMGLDHGRNGHLERPMTFEEHQRAEPFHREQRKPSDGTGHRALVHNLSPDLNRKGRNSPLPQAVQGAQPRHVGPGGDNPGIKMEFGRMFSGLGSGAGSNAPNGTNGSTTPSRISPVRQVDMGDGNKASAFDGEEARTANRAGRGAKANRRVREDDEKALDGRGTPDGHRGSNKRPKASHHHHHHVHAHHHHHRHDPTEAQNGTFNMLRFPSNPRPAQNVPTSQSIHHFHHHHNTHGHPGHHHHHHAPRAPAAPVRQSTITVINKKLVEDVASRPRKHLGSQLYQAARISLPAAKDALQDPKIKYRSETRAIPRFEDRANCTFTVRVPRWYLQAASSLDTAKVNPLQEICRHGQLWGSEVYTDDSDVIAAAVHSGWVRGDFGELNEDLHDLIDRDSAIDAGEEPPLSILSLPSRPARPLAGHDMHVTVLLLPALRSYTGTLRNHVRSRDWDGTHDGMSMIIHRIDFVDEGLSSRSFERTSASRKSRIANEEAQRREAADSLLMFANGLHSGAVSVGA